MGVAGANPLLAFVFLVCFFFFANIEYLFYSFVLRGRRTAVGANANPLLLLFFFSVSFSSPI